MTEAPRPQDPKPYYRHLLADNGCVEVRHQLGGRWFSYWFDNAADLFTLLREQYHAGEFYASLNAPKPRVVRNGTSVQNALKNEDVAWITRIPFDFDPVRPAGTASSDAQLSAAYVVRNALVELLGPSWGAPLLAMSGNGYHAQYRTRLPNNAETKEMLDALYLGLAKIISTGVDKTGSVSFDTTVRNPGRIFRAYGTINRKGGASRKTTVWIPPTWDELTPEQIAAVADWCRQSLPQRHRSDETGPRTGIDLSTTGKGDFRTLDVVAWFRAHGLYLSEIEPGKHAVRCPFAEEHTTPTGPKDSVVRESTGENWPTFHCSHAHCEGRGIRDVMRALGDADRFCSAVFSEAERWSSFGLSVLMNVAD